MEGNNANYNSGDDEPFVDETEQIFGDENEEQLEPEGEDLFNDNMETDYRPIPELDTYEIEGVDDSVDYESLSPTSRAAAERQMRRRDRERELAAGGRRDTLADLVESEEEDMETDAVTAGRGAERRQKIAELVAQRQGGPKTEAAPLINLDNLENFGDMKGRNAALWAEQPSSKIAVRRKFMEFLRDYQNDNGNHVYIERIRNMCADNKQTITVEYDHLAETEQVLAFVLPEAPSVVLEIFNEGAADLVLSLFPSYTKIQPRTYVRFTNLPLVEDLRGLRQHHLNQMIATKGIITGISSVMPQLNIVKYRCTRCNALYGPYTVHYQLQDANEKPISCSECQSLNSFVIDSENTIYKNHQKVIIQESPGKIPPGRLPRSKEVILLDDLVDICKPGDEVEVIGIYTHSLGSTLNTKNGFPVFGTMLLANNVIKNDEKMIVSTLTDEDIRIIQQLARDERISERIFASIAPSIYGHEDIKRALALALFGGESKDPGGKHRVRGDINVLLCGDPGTAKSQFLKYIQQIAPRCVFSTGQGASAVGLTASVIKSAATKEWTLEAGALVLADKGVCLIDEFDKMTDKDRTSIHEAMEQQSISISKAGIVTSLQARCTVLAASNPIGGRYDPSCTFIDNVDLTEPILSRFDILCVVRDVVDSVEDERLAKFVVGSHMAHHPQLTVEEKEGIAKFLHSEGCEPGQNAGEKPIEPIPQDIMKKYITFSKERIHPKLNQMDQDKVARAYTELRKESMATGSIPITVRHIESVIRMSEAHARMHLRDYVVEDDVNLSLRVMLESFIATQKHSIMKLMQRNFSRFLTYRRDNHELLLFMLRQIVHDKRQFVVSLHSTATGQQPTQNIDDFDSQASDLVVQVLEKELIEKAKQIRVQQSVSSFLQSDLFRNNQFKYDSQSKVIYSRV